MSHSVKLPSICEAEAEAFVRSAPRAVSPDLRPLSPLAIVPGRAYVAGDVPPALRSFLDGECGSLTCPDATGSCEPLTLQLSASEVAELGEFDRLDQRRTQLLCELIFAARDLAQDQVVRECPGAQLRCLECLALTFRADQTLIHMDGCKAVRVLEVIGKLLETSSQLATIATSGNGVIA